MSNAPLMLTLGLGLALVPADLVRAEDAGAIPNSSRLSRRVVRFDEAPDADPPHRLIDHSMIAVADAKPRQFRKHDLVQIIVEEASRAESTHELETDKEWLMEGKIEAWPDFNLSDLLNLQLYAGRTTALPELKMGFAKGFAGEGDYTREDLVTTRISAEIIAIRPNGNLVLEARTFIKTDEEETTITVTGECRPDDISAGNALLSHRIHDLRIEKSHTGELKKANEKGLIAKFFEAVFAF